MVIALNSVVRIHGCRYTSVGGANKLELFFFLVLHLHLPLTLHIFAFTTLVSPITYNCTVIFTFSGWSYRGAHRGAQGGQGGGWSGGRGEKGGNRGHFFVGDDNQRRVYYS